MFKKSTNIRKYEQAQYRMNFVLFNETDTINYIQSNWRDVIEIDRLKFSQSSLKFNVVSHLYM